jgi:MerR family transcriptional regulator, copper efflux regulator
MLVAKTLTIGVLAREAGCSVPTIRYYEEIGLLPRARRGAGGQRYYADCDLRRLSFIRRCRDFGFSIDQVAKFVALVRSPQSDCTAARDLAKAHLHSVRRKLKELHALEHSLKDYVERCDAECAGGPANACVILEDLDLQKPSKCCGSQRNA